MITWTNRSPMRSEATIGSHHLEMCYFRDGEAGFWAVLVDGVLRERAVDQTAAHLAAARAATALTQGCAAA
jgi:hypothetical protein